MLLGVTGVDGRILGSLGGDFCESRRGGRGMMDVCRAETRERKYDQLQFLQNVEGYYLPPSAAIVMGVIRDKARRRGIDKDSRVQSGRRRRGRRGEG